MAILRNLNREVATPGPPLFVATPRLLATMRILRYA
jgi:hypothetical protein